MDIVKKRSNPFGVRINRTKTVDVPIAFGRRSAMNRIVSVGRQIRMHSSDYSKQQGCTRHRIDVGRLAGGEDTEAICDGRIMFEHKGKYCRPAFTIIRLLPVKWKTKRSNKM